MWFDYFYEPGMKPVGMIPLLTHFSSMRREVMCPKGELWPTLTYFAPFPAFMHYLHGTDIRWYLRNRYVRRGAILFDLIKACGYIMIGHKSKFLFPENTYLPSNMF